MVPRRNREASARDVSCPLTASKSAPSQWSRTEASRGSSPLHRLAFAAFPVLLLCIAGAVADEPEHKARGRPERASAESGKLFSEAAQEDFSALIGALSSPIAAERNAATKALLEAGLKALPELKRAMASDDAEVRRRAMFLAESLERKAIEHFRRRGIQVSVSKETGAARSLSVADQAIEAEDLVQLAALFRLENLAFRNTNISNEGLRVVGQLATLETLGFGAGCDNVTDDGLSHLAKLHTLTHLSFSGTKIEGRGLAALADLDSLRVLGLGACPLDESSLIEGLGSMKPDGPLRSLSLTYGAVGRMALRTIASKECIERLQLDGTDVTDADLDILRMMPKLRNLDLRRTRVSDAGARKLATFPALGHVGLYDTQVTIAGLLSLGESKSLKAVGFNVQITPEESLQLREKWRWLGPAKTSFPQ